MKEKQQKNLHNENPPNFSLSLFPQPLNVTRMN